MIGQRGWGCEGVGRPLVGERHAHRAGGWAEAQGAVVEAPVTDGSETGWGALVQLAVARQGVPPGATATTRVGH